MFGVLPCLIANAALPNHLGVRLPLVMQQDYRYPDGRKVRFTRVSFYISDLTFSGDDRAVLIKDVDFVDLTSSHSSLNNAQQAQLIWDKTTDQLNVAASHLRRLAQISFKQSRPLPSPMQEGHPKQLQAVPTMIQTAQTSF